MKKEYYVITDLEEFVKSLRIVVYNNFASNKPNYSDTIDLDTGSEEEFEKCLNQQECLTIVKSKLKVQYNNSRTKYRYITTEKRTHQIIELLHSRMVSNLLSGLVSKGVLEMAFDESINDFVFWETSIKNEDTPNVPKDIIITNKDIDKEEK